METKTPKGLEANVDLGLKVAVTDEARARLTELLEDESHGKATGTGSPSSQASMIVLRLNEDEIGNRTMPVIGQYSQVDDLSSG